MHLSRVPNKIALVIYLFTRNKIRMDKLILNLTFYEFHENMSGNLNFHLCFTVLMPTLYKGTNTFLDFSINI
jgi:hypothetical protein